MAGQRNPTLVMNIGSPATNQEIYFWLGGAYELFYFAPATSADSLNKVRYLNAGQTDTPENRMKTLGENLAQAVLDRMKTRGLEGKYTAYSVRLTTNLYNFRIEATTWDSDLNFIKPTVYARGAAEAGFRDLANYTAIPPISIQLTPYMARCFAQPSGSIEAAAGGGTAPYTYLWDDGSTDQNRKGVLGGQHTLAVTDASGATESKTVFVDQNSRISVVIDKQNGLVRLLTSGGVPGYTYLWDDGITAAERADLPAGKYSATVTDSLGCTSTVDVAVQREQYFFSQNPILLPVDAGDEYRADNSSKPNLSFICEVWVEPDYLSDTFERAGSIEQPADRNGRTEFQVELLLDAYLAEFLPNFDPSQRLQRADSQFKRFYLKYTERFGDLVQDAGLVNLQQNMVVLGGLDRFEYASRTWFNSYQPAQRPFLTWQPHRKIVLDDQPEFLCLLVTASAALPTQLRLLANVHFADDTSVLGQYGIVQDPRRFEVHCFSVGFLALYLGRFANLGQQVVGWDVFVGDQNEVPISEVRSYVLDPSYYPQRRYFVYTNSLGGLDTLAVTGEAKRTLAPAQDEAMRSPDPHYDPAVADVVVLDRSAGNVLSVVTQLPTRAALLAAQELLLSRRVTLLRDGTYWPGKVKPKETVVDDDSATVRTLEFDFVLPTQRLFTPRLPATPAGQPALPMSAGEGPQP